MQPIPLSKPMTPELARAIYAVLVAGIDAEPPDLGAFLDVFRDNENRGWRAMKEHKPHSGYRFVVHDGACYVDCLWDEDRTPIRQAMIDRTMRALAVLMEGK